MPRFPGQHNAGPRERRRWKTKGSVVEAMRSCTDMSGRHPTPIELGYTIRRSPYVALYLLLDELTPEDPEWEYYSVANILRRAWEACRQRIGGGKVRARDLECELGLNRAVIRDWLRRYPMEAGEW